MPNMTLAPRRRPLWRLFIMPVLLLVAAVAWSAFWFFAASQVDVRADAWRAQEAKSGRVYDCAKRSVAGFPFRLEVRYAGAHDCAARRNPRRVPGLRSQIADRGIHRAGDDRRLRPATIDDRELEQGAQQRGGTAGDSAARLDRVRRSLDRSPRWIGAGAACGRKTHR